MSNALIYSPGLDGHRQVYVFVLASILKELNFKLFLACNFTQRVSNSYYIDRVKMQHDITLIDTSTYPEGGLDISLSDFLELQIKYNIDLTVFAEADHHISLLTSQVQRRLRRLNGRLVGIFLRPFYYYKRLSLYDQLRYLKHLPTEWRHDTRFFHEVLLKRFSLLNFALYLDEKYVSGHKNTVWLPDVFQQFADEVHYEEKPEQRIWIDKLKVFKEKNQGRNLFLYFGTSQYRRGYDILMRLADETNGCFIHCGLRNESEYFEYDINNMRSSLDKKGNLFETNQFIEDPACVEAFFRAVSHLVLPYRNFFGSSGVMLQALNFGIPVLAPETGLIGHRIKKHNLGLTYNEKDPGSLLNHYKIFIRTDPREYVSGIHSYMKYQTTGNLEKSLTSVFRNIGEIVKCP